MIASSSKTLVVTKNITVLPLLSCCNYAANVPFYRNILKPALTVSGLFPPLGLKELIMKYKDECDVGKH